MQLLTKKEVANRCKMPVKWVEKAASSGKIPSPVYLDGNKRWREKDIDNWIQAGCLRVPEPKDIPKNVQLYEDTLNLGKVEKRTIIRALDVAQHNRVKTAQLLGIGERTLYRKIKEYRLG